MKKENKKIKKQVNKNDDIESIIKELDIKFSKLDIEDNNSNNLEDILKNISNMEEKDKKE